VKQTVPSYNENLYQKLSQISCKNVYRESLNSSNNFLSLWTQAGMLNKWI